MDLEDIETNDPRKAEILDAALILKRAIENIEDVASVLDNLETDADDGTAMEDLIYETLRSLSWRISMQIEDLHESLTDMEEVVCESYDVAIEEDAKEQAEDARRIAEEMNPEESEEDEDEADQGEFGNDLED